MRPHILAVLPAWVVAGMTDVLVAVLATYAPGSGGWAAGLEEMSRRDATAVVQTVPEPELEPVVQTPELPEPRAPWQHMWTTKAAARAAVRDEWHELVRLAEERAERETYGYATELAEWREANPVPTLTEHLRAWGLEPELRPSQGAARRTYRTRSHADAKRAQERARKRSLENRTLDRLERSRGGAR